ncbi:MAG: CotH kinase family protein [Verrucomicrobia bacterium]|nr:CotH kinase family protein [Verrucomicrobiota bacterium]
MNPFKRLVLSLLSLSLAAGISDAVFAAAAGQKEQKPAEVKFSQNRGFFEQPFELRLTASAADAEIRFTTDGTSPRATNGTVSSGPIKIERTTVIRAAAIKKGAKEIKVKTHTYVFSSDVIRQSSDGLPPAGWHYTWGVNKVDYGMDPRVVDDPRYRDNIVGDLKSLPSFSLVMNLEDLFGTDRGIYAEARLSGRETEKPCSLELIYPDSRKGFQVDAGIRIRGGFSRMPMNPKHAFRFFFRKEYGDGKLKFPLFGKDAAKEFDGFDLRTPQNYSWHMGGDPNAIFLRDQSNRDTQLAMGQPAARGDFYHLYINGQYWGLYNTCERPEASYAESYFGGAKEDYDVIKNRGGFASAAGNKTSPFATDGNIEAWKRLYNLAKSGLGNPETYQKTLGNNPDGTRNPKYEVLLDPVNLIDYMLVIFYGGNMDAPASKFMGNNMANNWYGIRSRKGDQGFRFFIWDAEHTLLELEEDRTGPFPAGDQFEQSNPQWLWQQCLESAEFRTLVADRIQRHFFHRGALTPESVTARFLARKKEIERAVVCESARWGDVQGGFPFGGPSRRGPDGGEPGPLTRDGEWKTAIDRVVNVYVPKRTAVVLNQLWMQGLWPDLVAPQFSQHGGQVQRGFPLTFFTISLAGQQGGRVAPEFAQTVKAAEETIYFTLDGSDPRLIGGKPSPKAKIFETPIAMAESGVIKCRAFSKGEWSPLNEAKFSVTAKL